MLKIIEKKYSSMLVWLCVAIYFVSYITRINYGAVLVEIIASKGIGKAAASLALTGSAVTYGVGQLISGYMGDKLKPHHLIISGLIITASMNALLPFCNFHMMIVAWCINGLAQAMMWPPIVKIMTSYLTVDEYKRGSVKVSWGSSFGTIAVYLLAPVIIKTLSWEYVFYFCAFFTLAMVFVLLFCYPKITSHAEYCETEVLSTSGTDSFACSINSVSVLLMFVCIAPGIILQGVLRDGITTWMPTYISDTYHLGSAVSILTGVVLPIFSILSYQFASFLNRKVVKNEMSCAAAIFLIGAVASALLFLAGNNSALLSVLMSAVITGAMHGVNVILICMTPPYFAKHGKVSLISGALNSCTYLGAALSTFGMAIISDRFGWHATIGVWALIALLGAVVCFLPAKLWKKFKLQ